LLSGFQGLKKREDTLPIGGKAYLKRDAQRLVTLYEATDQADKAAHWKKELADFEKVKTEQ
jgi:eukaryotic-like serine/threonine-protein kinase